MRAPFRLVLAAIAILAVLSAVPAGAEEASAALAEPADQLALVADGSRSPLVCAVDIFAPVSAQEPMGDWMDLLRQDRFKSPYGFGYCPAPCAYDCPFCPSFKDCPEPQCNGWGSCCDYGG